MTLISNPKNFQLLGNEKIVIQILEELAHCGVRDICVCPGGRNTPFVNALDKIPFFNTYYWPEERSAGFFALGKSKRTLLPTAVITTSGTAVGELLPAAMEAYYSGVPLVFVTADRPRRFRGSGAPQAAEQVGIFGQYAVFEQDIADQDTCLLNQWKKNGMAHINVCLEEPLTQTFENFSPALPSNVVLENEFSVDLMHERLDRFLQKCRFPLVVVGAINTKKNQAIVNFLRRYQAPVYLEAVSGLREDPLLQEIRVSRTEQMWRAAEAAAYPIDGILRIGGVPTVRLWRDLENLEGKIQVCSLSDLPFSGLSWDTIQPVGLENFFQHFEFKSLANENPKSWLVAEQHYRENLITLLEEEPTSEASLIHQLSCKIPSESLIYLGNSLPIREWDAFASFHSRHSQVYANRGLNGIDGQLSTFFGMCTSDHPNWGIVGDLTTLYDLAGPWILEQMPHIPMNLVVINNGGGKIFARMFSNKKIQNTHQVRFKSLAELWNMRYVYYTQPLEHLPYGGHRLIEIVPDDESTIRFWNRIGNL